MKIIRNNPSGETGRLTIPLSVCIGAMTICMLLIAAPASVGRLIGTGKPAFVMALAAVCAGGIGVHYIYIKGTMAQLTATLFAALPMAALISTRLFVGEPPFNYGLDFLFLWALVWFLARRAPRPYHRVACSWALFLYVTMSFMSAIMTQYSFAVAIDHWFIAVLLPVALFIVISRARWSKQEMWWLLVGLVAAACLAIAIALVHFTASASTHRWNVKAALVLGDYTVGAQLARSLTGGPWGSGAMLSRLIVFSMPLCVGFIVKRNLSVHFRLLMVSMAGLLMYSLLIGQTRSALLGCSFGCLTTLWMVRTRRKWLLIAVLVVGVVAGYANISDYLERRPILVYDHGAIRIETAQRFEISFPLAWKMFTANPVLGVGPGDQNFVDASGKYGPPQRHAHNMFLQLLADRGLLAACAFSAILFGALYRSFRFCRHALEKDEQLLWASVFGSLVGVFIYFQGSSFFALGRLVWMDCIFWAIMAMPYIPAKPASTTQTNIRIPTCQGPHRMR